jgi:hypothetical protein
VGLTSDRAWTLVYEAASIKNTTTAATPSIFFKFIFASSVFKKLSAAASSRRRRDTTAAALREINHRSLCHCDSPVCGIEFARGRHALTNDRTAGTEREAISVAPPPSLHPRAELRGRRDEPSQSKFQHDCRGNHANPRCSKERGADTNRQAPC